MSRSPLRRRRLGPGHLRTGVLLRARLRTGDLRRGHWSTGHLRRRRLRWNHWRRRHRQGTGLSSRSGGFHRSARRDRPGRHGRPNRLRTHSWPGRLARHHRPGRFCACGSQARLHRSGRSGRGSRWSHPASGRLVQATQVFFRQAAGAPGRRGCRHIVKSPQLRETGQRRTLGRGRNVVHQRHRTRRHRLGRRPGPGRHRRGHPRR